MKMVYEAHTGLKTKDYYHEQDARAAVEAHGGGKVVTFAVTSLGDKSCALNVYRDGAWRGVDISR